MAEYNVNLPKTTELTIQQQAALEEEEAVAISGGAGTGKSIVSIYRHLFNYERGKKSILVTYTKSLQKYLYKAVLSKNKEAAKKVHTAMGCMKLENEQYCKGYDEIIIDEAQDLYIEHIKKFKYFASMISYGADFRQKLYDTDLTEEKIKNIFPTNEKYELQQNFRNTKQIINFVKGIFPDFKIDSREIKKIGNKPRLCIVNENNKIIQILEIIEEFATEKENLAILVPFVKDVEYYYNELRKLNIECSYYHNKLELLPIITNIHITTFKSSKGLEFDTVIIPDFQNYKDNIDTKYTIQENDYYVAFTRAKTNLFLISNRDLNLKEDICDKEEF